MKETIILCYRDLVTEVKETIRSHKQIINEHGYCWWGWWKKPIEDVPIELFAKLTSRTNGFTSPQVLLYDCGAYELYRATLEDIEVAPSGGSMSSPDIDKTPEYYFHLRCAVWFKFKQIDEVSDPESEIKKWIYVDFPSWPRPASHDGLRETNIQNFEQMDEMKVTLWHVREPNGSGERSDVTT